MTWREWADAESAAVHAAGQWRTPRDLDAAGPEGKLAPDGRPVVSFASNDYLGLTQHPAVIAAAHTALDRWGAGSGSARLIVGSRPVHTELEHTLADWKHAEAAVCFPTGFAANLGVLTTFGGPEVLICSDELNHASIIDGARLARADVAVYRHADAAHVDALFRDAQYERAIVVTDTVFSMDGDVAPLAALVDVCARPARCSCSTKRTQYWGRTSRPTRWMSSASAPCRRRWGRSADSSPGRAGSPISSSTARGPTSSPPHPRRPMPAATLAAVGVLQSVEGDALRSRLRAHVERVRPGHPSPIVPVVIGDERATLAASAALLEQGLLVPAIRPPTVAPGTSRLRVALSAAHTDEQIDALVAALASL